jgi:hypothetical protein
VLLPSVIALAAIGVGTWQVDATRSQLRDTRQQLATLRRSDARQIANLRSTSAKLTQARVKEQALASALASAQQTVTQLQYLATTTTTIPCQYAYENNVGQTLCSPAPVLTDPTVLEQALDSAAQQLMGEDPPSGQEQAFVNQFQTDQEQQEHDGAMGEAWSILDPTTEAAAYINANDQAAVMAARMAQEASGVMKCMFTVNPSCP